MAVYDRSMDTITHSLLGALVVRAAFPASGSQQPLSDRQRMLVGAIAGAFPDIDYIGAFIDPMVYLTLWHRSITHSLVLLPLWALLLGGVLALVFRQRHAWLFVSLMAGTAMLSHIAADLITVYGTQIFAPLSTWRASVGTTFIIDPWFSLIVLTGFLAGLGRRFPRLPRISLALLAGYIAFQATLKQQALAIAHRYAERENLQANRIAALPQPLSPFNWKIIIEAGDRYAASYVNLAGGYQPVTNGTGILAGVRNTYQDAEQLNWQTFYRYGNDTRAAWQIQAIWENPQLDNFRRFAEFPFLYRVAQREQNTCVWFTDLRYVLPYMTPPFRYGLCGAISTSDWNLQRLRD